jgi:hypothetical protein
MAQMQCPQCHAKVRFAQIAKHRCPNCGAKIYLSDKCRWLRGLGCGLIVILLNYRWYPLEGSFALHITWCFVVLLTFFVLLLSSIYLLPPEVDLAPQDGPIRLDL